MQKIWSTLAAIAFAIVCISTSVHAQTFVQFGANRTVSPWAICIYDQNNTCQEFMTLPATGGGALIPSQYGGTGVNNGTKTLTLGGSLATTGSGSIALAFPNSAQTYTFPTVGDTLVGIAATQTLSNKTLVSPVIAGSSTGYTTLASANAGATNYTLTFPAVTDTVATLGAVSAALPLATTSQIYGGSGTAGVAAVLSTLPNAAFPALTGDVTTTAGSLATTLATVNANVGSFGTVTQAPQITVNAKGLTTAAANVTITPAIGSVTGLGTNVEPALTNATNGANGIVVQDSGGNINIAAGSAYEYGGTQIVIAQPSLSNYFFGDAGNLTMTGAYNTANGQGALVANTTGSQNTAIGRYAGYNGSVSLQTLTNSTFLGYGANSSVDGVTNSTAIGNGAQVTTSNEVVIGNPSVTQTLLHGTVTANLANATGYPLANLAGAGTGVLTAGALGVNTAGGFATSAVTSLPSLAGVGTLTSGATGTGFTLDFGASTLSNQIGTANLPQIAADSVLLNATASSASPTGQPIGNCASALTYSTSTHSFSCNSGLGTGNVTGTGTSVVGDLPSLSNTSTTGIVDSGITLSAIRFISSGTADTLSAGDYLVSWTGTVTGARTETIPACGSAIKSKPYVVKDGSDQAGLYPIALTPVSGTIDGAATQPLSISGGAATIICDGVSNWVMK